MCLHAMHAYISLNTSAYLSWKQDCCETGNVIKLLKKQLHVTAQFFHVHIDVKCRTGYLPYIKKWQRDEVGSAEDLNTILLSSIKLLLPELSHFLGLR